MSDLLRVAKCRGIGLRGNGIVGRSPQIVLDYDTMTGKCSMSMMTQCLSDGNVGGCVMSVNNRLIMGKIGPGRRT